jgi:hypothetical protein
MKKCRRQNLEVQLMGDVWWNSREIFDKEMARRLAETDRRARSRMEELYGSDRSGDREIPR